MNSLIKIEKNKVIQTLKEGKILISIIDKKRTFFKMKDKFIYVKNDKSSYYLNSSDFLEIYYINDFYLYESDDNQEIDFEKDIEYYSLDNKKL